MDTPATGAAASTRSGALNYILLAAILVVGAIFVLSGSIAVPNDWYALFKAIHVGLAVIWVGGGAFLTICAVRAKRKNDTNEILTIAQQAAFAGEKIFAPAGLIVFLMGIAMMINTSWGWGHFWVVAGLIGYAVTFITGVAVLSPLAKKIEASAHENGPTHPTTMALIDRIMLIARIDVTVLFLVILDMVTKPFA